MNSLSVIIITKNEAKNIVACLESVKFADEIIVLDSGSTDDTLKLCRQYTAKVYQTDWPGFGIQKNRALQKAEGEWVLSIDADERIDAQLKQAISTIIHENDPTYAGFYLPRATSYCAKSIKFGDWKNDRYIRLFRRNRAEFTNAAVHEKVIVHGKVGKIKAPLRHYSYTNLEDVLNKMNLYSTLSAQQKYQRGRKASLKYALMAALWCFLRGYFLKFGFLDGRKGLMLAISNAQGCYYRYAKLMLLHEQRPPT
jgi:glycosyltransferase involved in cell wall biosynthesis